MFGSERKTSLFFRFGCFQLPQESGAGFNSVPGCTWKHVQDRVQNPATNCQEWHKDNPCLGTTWKHVQSDVCERSGSSWKHVQGIENQLEKTGLHFHHMQISEYRYVNKVFENFQQKLCLRSNVLDEKTNVLIWGLFMSTTMKASVHLGPSYNEKVGGVQKHRLQRAQTLFDITQRLFLEQSFEILTVSTMVWRFTPWMRSTLCHDQVI